MGNLDICEGHFLEWSIFNTKECKLKGIFSDFTMFIFLWYESENINQKSLFPKFHLIPILCFQVMHDYMCFIAPIDYRVE